MQTEIQLLTWEGLICISGLANQRDLDASISFESRQRKGSSLGLNIYYLLTFWPIFFQFLFEISENTGKEE
jgi:hypothetical protein